MKRQRSSRKQPPARPGFPRGLELMLWFVGTALLACGLARIWPDKVAGEAAKATPNQIAHAPQQPPRNPKSAGGWMRVETPQALFLKRALAKIHGEENLGRREELLAGLVDSIAVADAQSVLNDLQASGGNDLTDEISLCLIRRWAKSDGHAAAAWAEQLPAGPMRENALSGAAIEWANNDLSAAAAWAEQLPDDPERSAVVSVVANEAVRSEPLEALRLAADLPPDQQRDDLICRSAMEWALADAGQALEWARQIGDDRLRDRVLSGIAMSWSEKDPVAAATLVAKAIPAGRTQSDAVIGILERWAQQEPAAAAAWVEQFSASDLKPVAVANVAQMWALSDPKKAEAWQSQMIAGQ